MNEQKNYELVKFVDGGFELNVNVSPKENTVWLTQKQMSLLFGVTTDNISLHIKNIIKENELDNSVTEEYSVTASDGKKYRTKIYNLDMIISVGYRVKSKRGVQFRIWANKVLKEYLLNGYVINESRTLVTNENYVRLINKVESMDERINIVENKLDSNIYNPKKVFVSGEYYDAYTYIQSLFQSANKVIIIIDNYIDRSILDRLVVKKKDVQVIIYTNNKQSKIIESDILKYNNQYGNLEIKYTNKVHDRFIIIDNLDLYHIGASLKDLGNKIFAIEKLDSLFIETIMNNL